MWCFALNFISYLVKCKLLILVTSPLSDVSNSIYTADIIMIIYDVFLNFTFYLASSESTLTSFPHVCASVCICICICVCIYIYICMHMYECTHIWRNVYALSVLTSLYCSFYFFCFYCLCLLCFYSYLLSFIYSRAKAHELMFYCWYISDSK